MKKLFWMVFFLIIIYIFNIDANASTDYSYLLSNSEENSFLTITVNLKNYEIEKIFENSKVSLVGIKPSDPVFNKMIREDGATIKEEMNNLTNKYVNKLINMGFEEKAMKYKMQGYNIESIKVFGKNKDIYNLIEKMYVE